MSFFHCYATANDGRFYRQDIINLVNIARLPSGVDRIQLYIAISKVRPLAKWDYRFCGFVRALFKDHPQIELVDISFKENVGRDFSSYQLINDKIQEQATADDYIFFQNRSAFGPYLENWYKKYLDCYYSAPDIALVGATINFKDHPSRSSQINVPHIQTYAFLSSAANFAAFTGAFPGSLAEDRSAIIVEGEIGLSRHFLANGDKLSCLEWPGMAISASDTAPVAIDNKKYVTQQHPFYHRRFFRKKRRKRVTNSGIYAYWILCKYFWHKFFTEHNSRRPSGADWDSV